MKSKLISLLFPFLLLGGCAKEKPQPQYVATPFREEIATVYKWTTPPMNTHLRKLVEDGHEVTDYYTDNKRHHLMFQTDNLAVEASYDDWHEQNKNENLEFTGMTDDGQLALAVSNLGATASLKYSVKSLDMNFNGVSERDEPMYTVYFYIDGVTEITYNTDSSGILDHHCYITNEFGIDQFGKKNWDYVSGKSEEVDEFPQDTELPFVRGFRHGFREIRGNLKWNNLLPFPKED